MQLIFLITLKTYFVTLLEHACLCKCENNYATK